MAQTRLVEFDADSLLNLLTHYTEGELPLDVELKNVSVSAYFPRWVCLIVESKDWTDTPFQAGDGYGGQQPMMIRYEGKRVMTLQHLQDPVAWGGEGEVEAPKRQ